MNLLSRCRAAPPRPDGGVLGRLHARGHRGVCSGDPVEREDVHGPGHRLGRPLAGRRRGRRRGTRYRLLETIRQYGEERLADWGETDALYAPARPLLRRLSARATEHSYGPDQLVWARQIKLEQDNIRSALARAIDTGDAALAVQLVANHPHHHGYGGTGEVFEIDVPACECSNCQSATEEPGLSPGADGRCIGMPYMGGDYDRADELRRQALDADRLTRDDGSPATGRDGHLQPDRRCCLAAGDYAGRRVRLRRGQPNWRDADGYPGLAAIYLAYGVNTCDCSGAAEAQNLTAKAEEARRAGPPIRDACGDRHHPQLLALALVDARSRTRPRRLFEEGIERSADTWRGSSSGSSPHAWSPAGYQDWNLTLNLGRSLDATWSAGSWPAAGRAVPGTVCARARRESARGRRCPAGSGLRAFQARGRPTPAPGQRSGSRTRRPQRQLRLDGAARDVGDIVAAALGDERARELRADREAAMSMDEAVYYALANIDPASSPVRSLASTGEHRAPPHRRPGRRHRPRRPQLRSATAPVRRTHRSSPDRSPR